MKRTSLALSLLAALAFVLLQAGAVRSASTATFYDAPSSHWAWKWIESLYQAGITGGCRADPLLYCPEAPVTRSQMAIFLLRGKFGENHQPDPATGTMFRDVNAGTFAAAWIEELAREGITAGCGEENYCPDAPVTRDQMAVFLLRSKHGRDHQPDPATGTMFLDVPSSHPYAGWIEELAREGITGGCGDRNYCPGAEITRAQMAVFLVRTFNLPPVPTPPGPAFPRLGMLWPRPDQQSHTAIARYDWVVLSDAASIYLDSLRQKNPNMYLLNSTDAHSISYYPGDPSANAYLQEIPYQWYLTQVGTTLRSDVNATQTVLPVEVVNISGYALFEPGEAALIEGESVLVQSVSAANKTITVQRGFIRPASPHAAGTRLAAHISFWENSWVMNVSSLSPLGVADPVYGSERWSDYNARQAAALLTDPRWDGILVDGANPTQSSLLYNSNARTIDPTQSNTLLTNYNAFDAAWTEGMTNYLQKLRSAVGPNRIVFLNLGTPVFSLVNGNNLEAFPQDAGNSYFAGWHTAVFGPLHTTKSYFEWLDNTLQPNLTMVETYEDDSTDGSFVNPCDKPGFTPNYRKMRFGLTTALLGDGYFSYEMSTYGHGALCLMWFDEYDNAGAGRGYLGHPLAPAQQIVTSLPTPNLVAGSGFNSPAEVNAWALWWPLNSGYAASFSRDSNQFVEGVSSARLDVTQTAGEEWGVSLFSSPVTLAAGSEYTLTFWAKADRPRQISAWVQQYQPPNRKSLIFDKISLTTGWKKYQLSNVAAFSSQGTDLKLIFALSETTGSIWLDDVRLQAGGMDVWRRDYLNGIALVNATSQPVTIPLGGTFRKINGTQVPSVNDGSLVTSVTLPPLDGIILLRP